MSHSGYSTHERSLAVHGLGPGAFTAKGPGSIPGQGTKIQQAMWWSQKQWRLLIVLPICKRSKKCQFWKHLALSLARTSSSSPQVPKGLSTNSTKTCITCRVIINFHLSQQWETCRQKPCFFCLFVFAWCFVIWQYLTNAISLSGGLD